MPVCDGLPTGPCPRKANNRSVKLSQGDLMLCPSCDAACFPTMTSATIKAPAGIAGPSIKQSAQVQYNYNTSF